MLPKEILLGILLGEGDSLALAYSNRSLVLYESRKWLEALRDIQLALDHQKNLEFKLRKRQGDCWMELKKEGETH